MQRQDLPWYPVLSLQKEDLETCYFNFGKLSRQDSKTLELEISSCRLTTAQSRCLARSMSTAIQACGRSRYVNSSYVRSSHYLVRLRGVSRSNVPTLCKRLFDITELSLPTSLLVCLCFDFWGTPPTSDVISTAASGISGHCGGICSATSVLSSVSLCLARCVYFAEYH